jgi:hypothetical protein
MAIAVDTRLPLLTDPWPGTHWKPNLPGKLMPGEAFDFVVIVCLRIPVCSAKQKYTTSLPRRMLRI